MTDWTGHLQPERMSRTQRNLLPRPRAAEVQRLLARVSCPAILQEDLVRRVLAALLVANSDWAASEDEASC